MEPQTSLPEWINSWQGAGVIARVRSQQMAERLAQLKVPVVDTL